MRTLSPVKFAALALALSALSPAAVSTLSADPLLSLGKKMSSAAEDLRGAKVAVLPFAFYDGRPSLGPSAVSERVASGILGQQKVAVVERSRTESLIRELTWQSMGVVDQAMVRQAGRVLGVEGVVTGTLIDIDGRHVEVVAHLVSAESGKVLQTATCEVKQFWKEASAMQRGAASASAPAETPPEAQSQSETPSADASAGSSAQDAPPAPPEETAVKLRQLDPIILDTRGEGGLDGQDYDLLATNWPLDVKQAGENSQVLEGYRVLKAGDAARALGIFTLAEKRFKRQPALRAVARLGLSLCHFQKGRKSQAASLAGSVAGLSEYPGISAAAHYVLGRYAENFGRHKKARGHFLDAIRATPFQTPLVKACSVRVKRLEAIFAE